MRPEAQTGPTPHHRWPWLVGRLLTGLLSALLTLTLLLVAGLALAPRLLPTIIERGLDKDIEVQTLAIERVSLDQIALAELSLITESQRFSAREIAVRIDPRPFRVLGIEIAHADLAIATGQGGTGGAPITPALPFPVRIDHLELRAATPWGAIQVPASLTAGPTAGGCFEGELDGPDGTAVLSSSPTGDTTLSLFDADGIAMLRLDATLGGEDQIPFRAHLTPRPFGDWLGRAQPLPEGLKALMTSYRLDGEPVEVTGVLGTNGDLRATVRGDLRIEDAGGDGERGFQSLQIRTRSGYTLMRTQEGWAGTGAVALAMAPQAGMRLTSADPDWRWGADGLRLTLARPALASHGVAADRLRLAVPEIAADAMAGEFELSGLGLTDHPTLSLAYDIAGRWSWHDGGLDASGNAESIGLPKQDWQLSAAPDGGQFETKMTGQLAALITSLEDQLPPSMRRLAVRSGDVRGQLHYAWGDGRPRADLSVDIGPINADLDAMRINGLEIQARNAANRLDSFQIRLQAPSLRLAAGATAEDLSARLRATRHKLHLDQVRARLFDGRLALHPTTIDPRDRQQTLSAAIEALSLERIMALFERPPVKLTGAISGQLQFTYEKDAGLAAAGQLHGIEPGTLKLGLAGDASQSGKLDNLALEALKDFHYTELSAEIAYRADDSYRIKARIVGNNPEVLDGHPIAFNPSIEGRLPALFKAFFITGDFNRAIIDGLRGR